MKYVSIDIETTGLNPRECQLLEIAAVIDDDGCTPIYFLPTFHARIACESVCGEPKALSMHANLLNGIVRARSYMDRNGLDVCTFEDILYVDEWQLKPQLKSFLSENGIDPLHIQVAGKNFGGFDKLFLDQCVGEGVEFQHRVLDPTLWYLQPGDKWLPSTQECLERSGRFGGDEAHMALKDARDIVWLVRRGIAKHLGGS